MGTDAWQVNAESRGHSSRLQPGAPAARHGPRSRGGTSGATNARFDALEQQPTKTLIHEDRFNEHRSAEDEAGRDRELGKQWEDSLASDICGGDAVVAQTPGSRD